MKRVKVTVDGGIPCADLVQEELMRRFSIGAVMRVHRVIEIYIQASESTAPALAEVALEFAGVESVVIE